MTGAIEWENWQNRGNVQSSEKQMNKTGTTRAKRTMVRPKTSTQTSPLSPSRSTTSHRNRSALRQSPEIRPSQIHELKLQTQQLRQQTIILKSQLKRTEFQISSKTSAINKTFEQSSDKPQGSGTIHAHTITNLKKNISGARNTLQKLKEQIEAATNDDKTSLVEELEEELKMTYCEYQRHAKTLQDVKAEAAYFDKQLEEAEFRASQPHINELRAAIKETKLENASLRDKANAYQVKLEKIDIEAQIQGYQQKRVPPQKVMDQLEIDRAEQNQRMKELCDELNAEQEQHEQNIAELTQILDEMRDKISQKLIERQNENSASRIEE